MDAKAEMRLRSTRQLLRSVAVADDIGSEDFRGRPVAEAFSRRGVQPGTEHTQVVPGAGRGVRISADPSPEPLVGVFDAAFLPRRLRVAEPRARIKLGLKVRPPVDELRPAVEGH